MRKVQVEGRFDCIKRGGVPKNLEEAGSSAEKREERRGSSTHGRCSSRGGGAATGPSSSDSPWSAFSSSSLLPASPVHPFPFPIFLCVQSLSWFPFHLSSFWFFLIFLLNYRGGWQNFPIRAGAQQGLSRSLSSNLGIISCLEFRYALTVFVYLTNLTGWRCHFSQRSIWLSV